MQSVLTDDYGDTWYRCHYTNALAIVDDVVQVGAIIPGVKAKYAIVKTMIHLHKESRELFNLSDANCNTCKEFVRVRHDKDISGLLQGRCKIAPERHILLYRKSGDTFWIHSDDAMHMQCYKPRTKQ